MSRRLLLGPIVAGVLAGAASSAYASTASIEHREYQCGRSLCGVTDVHYVAAPGERNDVVLTSGSEVTIEDRGAGIEAGPGCAQLERGVVRCSWGRPKLVLGDQDDQLVFAAQQGGWRSAHVAGGEGDDEIHVQSAVFETSDLAGGPGDDVLVGAGVLKGGPGADVLIGSHGPDHMTGGEGADQLSGGGSDDVLRGDERDAVPAADVIDGGDGRDAVSYSERTDPVNVDLTDPGPDGASGERDALAGVEDVQGGAGPDVLRGDGGSNRLEAIGPDTSRSAAGDRLEGAAGDDVLLGASGHDVLIGGDGEDRMTGGRGADRLDGGAGGDRFFLRDSDRETIDRVACGGGVDVATEPTGADRIPGDCERVQFQGVSIGPARWSGRTVEFTLRRDEYGFGGLCRMSLRLETTGRRAVVLGTGTAHRPGRATAVLRVRLTPAGRSRRPRRGYSVHVRVALQPRCSRSPRFDDGSYVSER